MVQNKTTPLSEKEYFEESDAGTSHYGYFLEEDVKEAVRRLIIFLKNCGYEEYNWLLEPTIKEIFGKELCEEKQDENI